MTRKTILRANDWVNECYKDEETPSDSDNVPESPSSLVDAIVQASTMENVLTTLLCNAYIYHYMFVLL